MFGDTEFQVEKAYTNMGPDLGGLFRFWEADRALVSQGLHLMQTEGSQMYSQSNPCLSITLIKNPF